MAAQDGRVALRVLVVLSGDEFVRNYVQSNAFASLGEDTHLGVIANERVTLREGLEDGPGFFGFYTSDPAIDHRHFTLFNLLMWRHRRVSSSFMFRIQRVLGADYLHHALRTKAGFRDRLRALKGFLRNHCLRPASWSFVLLGSRLLFAPVKSYLIRSLPVNQSLQKAIHDFAPDLVVFPSSAYDPAGNDVVRVAEALGIPSLFLVDNWDNLSSKSILWAVPDALGVWGPQSVKHAIEIQGVPSERITPLGTPRFDRYYVLRDGETASPFPFPYILFVGCALPFDEISALEMLDSELTGGENDYGDTRIVYRPHPWRQKRLRERPFDENSFVRVELDPQMRSDFSKRRLMPKLDYYGPLLQNAEMVVAPLTTMLIEALIFTKKTLVIAYDDGVHFSSPRNALANYEHFHGIEQIPGLQTVEKKDCLAAAFRQMWHVDEPQRQDVDRALSYFLHSDERRYDQRLRDFVLRVAAQSETL